MRSRLPYLALALLCGVLFFWRLGAVPLMGLDEGLYAECSREMLASGDYVVPTCNGGPFFDKPPIVYWLQAASMRAIGVNSLGARLPSAIEELLLVALTVFLGTKLFSRRAGLMAGFALASSLLAAGLARMAILDAAFALAITASLGAFLLAYLKLAPKWTYLLFWAAMGLAVMVKGPAGAVLICATVLIFLTVRRDLRAIRRTTPILGIALFLLIAAPWYALVQQRTGGAFLREFIVHQNLQRALGKDFQHNMPIYAYIPIYLVGFFPWSVFLPAAFKRRESAGDGIRTTMTFLTVWICTVFVIFSSFKSKLPAYIFPIYPASALLVGLLWDRAAEEREFGVLRKCTFVVIVTSCLVGGALLLAPVFVVHPIPELASVSLMGPCLVMGSAVCYDQLRLKRPNAAFAGLCCGMSVFILCAVGLGLPIAARRNAAPAMELGRMLAKRSESAFAYRLSPPQPELGFYSGKPVAMVDDPSVISNRQPYLLIVQDDGRFEPPVGGEVQAKVGPYVLLRYPSSRN